MLEGKIRRTVVRNPDGTLQISERGAEPGRGGRLRHQSLTSISGAYTLMHQDDGDPVLYSNPEHRTVWATNTWWAGDGWTALTEDGDLVVRNLCGAAVWRSGTAGAGAQWLVSTAVEELGGPGDELVVEPGSAVLRHTNGTIVWRNGVRAEEAEDTNDWAPGPGTPCPARRRSRTIAPRTAPP